MSSRVATAQMYKTYENHIATAREREMTSSEKASSLKEIVRPSQDPTGWAQAQRLKDDLSTNETISRNGSLATHILNTTDSVLGQVMDTLQQAHTVAVQGASDNAGTADTRKHLLDEARTLYDVTLRSLNSRYAGKTLFGGFQTKQPAFDSDGSYLGDEGVWKVEVGKNLVVPLNLSAAEVFQGEGRANGTNILGTLKRLMTGLQQNDFGLIRSTLDELTTGMDQISAARSQIGARVTEVERTLRNQDNEKILILSDISKIEEADPIKAFSDLAKDQSALKAAMATGQKVLLEDPSAIFFK